jgi:hypothetical protein
VSSRFWVRKKGLITAQEAAQLFCFSLPSWCMQLAWLLSAIVMHACGLASHHVFLQDFQNQAIPGQKQKQNFSIPQWTWMKTGNKIRDNAKGNTGGEPSWVCKEL